MSTQNEKPVIFNSEMGRAILNGRKTQTRRIAKLPKEWHTGVGAFKNNPHGDEVFIIHGDCGTKTMYCPYGRVGDGLWVRETWRCTGGGDLRNIVYKAEGDSPMSFCGVDDGRKGILHVPEPHWAEWDRLVYKTNRGCNWRSPIHMYKWAARLWLEITGIRVERVQEMTTEDAWAEGVEGIEPIDALSEFAYLWDSINAKRGYSCAKNPWVWVIEFRKVKDGE